MIYGLIPVQGSWLTIGEEVREDCGVHPERMRVAEVEGCHDGSTDIPMEHTEVCAWDIAECDVDESQRTVHGSRLMVK